MVVLKYIGDGRWIPGVPKQNLTQDLIEKFDLDPDVLIKSGLYELADPPKGSKKKTAQKESKLKPGGEENKEI